MPFENITRIVHDLDVDDVYNVYGATLFATPPNVYLLFIGREQITRFQEKAVINVAIFAILPPYFIAYLVFVVCCVKISRMLSSFGVKLSTKTMRMQRSFLKMMLMQVNNADRMMGGEYRTNLGNGSSRDQESLIYNIYFQGLLPLLVLSVPVGMFVTAMLSNMAMDKQTLVITFCIWAIPIIQVRCLRLSKLDNIDITGRNCS